MSVKFSASTKELLALHQMFRTMGFPPSDLYVAFNEQTGQIQFQAVQKDKTFVINISDFTTNEVFDTVSIATEWRTATEWWNSQATFEEMSELFDNSIARANGVQIIMKLKERGFYIPSKPVRPEGHDKKLN